LERRCFRRRQAYGGQVQRLWATGPKEPSRMRPTCAFLFAFSLAMLPALHAEKIDNRNFAIDTCFPTANAIQLAEGRARAYWAKHAARFGPEPRFLAVETSKVSRAKFKTFGQD